MDLYALEFVGGPDGTVQPPKKLDGRVVSAKKRRTRAVKPTIILNIGDRLYIGKLPQDGLLQQLSGNFDTSLGATTLSIGTTTTPAKYANAVTLTDVNKPVAIGPRSAAAVLAPTTVDENLWVTIGGAAIPAAVVGAFYMEYTIAT
jgi:hypothetical protein